MDRVEGRDVRIGWRQGWAIWPKNMQALFLNKFFNCDLTCDFLSNFGELLERWHPMTVPRCIWSLHGCVLDFLHLSATGVAKIAKSTNLKWCPHTLYSIYKSMITCHNVSNWLTFCQVFSTSQAKAFIMQIMLPCLWFYCCHLFDSYSS